MRKFLILLLVFVTLNAGAQEDNFIRGYQFAGATGLYTGADLEDLVTEARFTEDTFDPTNTNRLFDTTFFTNVTLSGVSNLMTLKDGSIGNQQLKTNAVTTDKILDGTILPADLSFTFTAKGYIQGMWPQYVDADTILFTNGSGYCEDNYFNLQTNITHDFTNLTTDFEFHHVYLDSSASTFPGTLVLYDSTNDPTYRTSEAGYYCATSTADRLLCSLLSTNATSPHLEAFVYDSGDCIITNQMIIEETLTGSPYWTNATVSVPTIIPPTASHILLEFYAVDSSIANTLTGAARKELRDLMPSPWDENPHACDIMLLSYGWLRDTVWMPLGASRDIYIFGDSVDNDWEVGIFGWRIYR